MAKIKKIWITWEIQRRNRSMSKELGIELYEVVIDGSRFLRYLLSMIRTFQIIHRNKPRIVIVQNPSIVLSLFSIFLRSIFRYKLVVDEHNAGIYPFEGCSLFLNKIAKYIAVTADNVIVTNINLGEIVKSWGGRPLILPDPLPDLGMTETPTCQERVLYNVLFICTWSPDEPFFELIEAAKELSSGIKISITGRHGDKVKHKKIPGNVELTGFLSESDFIERLKNSDAVIVLTHRENCLNCGAYEAVAAGKPLILSDKKALREYFNRGVIFTKNNPIDIARKIDYICMNKIELEKEVGLLKEDLVSRWLKMKKSLNDTVLL